MRRRSRASHVRFLRHQIVRGKRTRQSLPLRGGGARSATEVPRSPRRILGTPHRAKSPSPEAAWPHCQSIFAEQTCQQEHLSVMACAMTAPLEGSLGGGGTNSFPNPPYLAGKAASRPGRARRAKHCTLHKNTPPLRRKKPTCCGKACFRAVAAGRYRTC